MLPLRSISVMATLAALVTTGACSEEEAGDSHAAKGSDAGTDSRVGNDDSGGPIVEEPIDGDAATAEDSGPDSGPTEMKPSEGMVFSTPGGTTAATLAFSTTDKAYLVCSAYKVKKNSLQLRLNLASPGSSLALGNYLLTASSSPPYLHGELYSYDANCGGTLEAKLLTGTLEIKKVTATELELTLQATYTGGAISGTFVVPICQKSFASVQAMGSPYCSN